MEYGAHDTFSLGAQNSDFRSQMLDLRFQISAFRFQVSDFKFFRLAVSDSQISDVRCFFCWGNRCGISDLGFQI